MMLSVVGAAAWLIPGAGYYILGDRRRGQVVLVTIALTFLTGLYIGSIGVINPVTSKPWYIAQIMNSPAVMLIGNHVAQRHNESLQRLQAASDTRNQAAIEKATASLDATMYRVYGKPQEIGQIYTSIAGLLNLLCIVNVMYLAHVRYSGPEKG
jgi:hypothetical protein